MAQARDPVCGMMVDEATAPARREYQGRLYVFCSAECERRFAADPARYAAQGAAAGAPPSPESTRAMGEGLERVVLEQHEPPWTTGRWFTAPKFGSAGSGGLEYEPLPEAHDKERKQR